MIPIRLPSPLKGALILLASAGLVFWLSGCGSAHTNKSSGGSGGPGAATTLQAETGNNTSAADSFVRQTNGNVGAGNVSKLPLKSLLPGGSNTKMYVTWLGWFGRQDHMNVGYNSGDAAQVHNQVQDMISRGVDGAIAAWYGAGTTSIESATQLLKKEAETHGGQFQFAIMEDTGALGSAAISNGCDVTDQLISDLTYIASEYESSPAYMRFNGRPVVFFFYVDSYYIDWNRVISSIPGNPLLIFQGPDGLTRKQSEGDSHGFSSIRVTPSIPNWGCRIVYTRRRNRRRAGWCSGQHIRASTTRWPHGEPIA